MMHSYSSKSLLVHLSSENVIITRTSTVLLSYYPIRMHHRMIVCSWRIAVAIPNVDQIELSKRLLTTVIQHVRSIPTFYATSMEAMDRINRYCKWKVRFAIERVKLILLAF